jgi:hypothetical protein
VRFEHETARGSPGANQETISMMKMTCVSSMVVCGMLSLSTHGGAATPSATAHVHVPAPAHPVVDLAICLDTSGSMQGLIDAARSKLWAVVNDLALARPQPRLRVALLTYGNQGHDQENGWVRIDAPFTSDLDLVSQQLFALTTNGGEEYVGRVIHSATNALAWSTEPGALKLIIVAGNESADQDQSVRFAGACAQAIARGIMVDSIYCGDPADEIAPGWREVARLADGQFAAIDHQNGTLAIASPFDVRLAELGAALNTTYIPYGSAGLAGQSNQATQDQNAKTMNSNAAAERALCKSGAQYQCTWDLVDACRSGQLKLESVKAEDLPEDLRKLSRAELQDRLDECFAKRTSLQQEIAELGRQRQAFIAAEMVKNALDPSKSLDAVLRGAIREQASAKGFQFPEDEPRVENAPVVASTKDDDC